MRTHHLTNSNTDLTELEDSDSDSGEIPDNQKRSEWREDDPYLAEAIAEELDKL